MDDIIDLELEKIEKIIAKIDSDPESEEVKEAENHHKLLVLIYMIKKH